MTRKRLQHECALAAAMAMADDARKGRDEDRAAFARTAYPYIRAAVETYAEVAERLGVEEEFIGPRLAKL